MSSSSKKIVASQKSLPRYIIRYLACSEAAEIAGGTFSDFLNFKEDSDGKRENPAGPDFPYCKSFSSTFTKDAYRDFMDRNHVIAVFDTKRLSEIVKKTGCKLLPWVYDLTPGAIDEKEWRIFSHEDPISFSGPSPIVKIIICGKYPVDIDEADEMVTEAYYAGIKEIVLVKSPFESPMKPLLYFGLDENDDLMAQLPDGTPIDVTSATTVQGLIKKRKK